MFVYFILLSVFLLFFISINIIPTFGFNSHKEIFNKALPFLKDEILNEMNKASLDTDNILDKYQYEEQYHFDGCNFFGSTMKINERYQIAVRHQDAEEFGRILHIAQDFYSHSNWVNFGRTDLVDDGLDKWEILFPLQITNSMVVLQGTAEELKKKGMDLKFEKDPYKVYVTTPNGEYQGLITGIVPPIYGPNRDNCPYPIETIKPPQHGMIPPYVNLVKGLAKDAKSYSPLFDDAFNLAVKQTEHEWCRLVNMVEQEFGEAKNRLIDKWVKPSQLMNMRECPQKWQGDYYDKIKITNKHGHILEFSNIGKFNFSINNDNTITGNGKGKLETPYDKSSPNFEFSIGGFYDKSTSSVRLKFSDFSSVSDYSNVFDKIMLELIQEKSPNREIKATMLYGFNLDSKLNNIANFLKHGPLCNKYYDVNDLMENLRTLGGATESINPADGSSISDLDEWHEMLYYVVAPSFGLFGDPGPRFPVPSTYNTMGLCAEPEIDISLKNKQVNVNKVNRYDIDGRSISTWDELQTGVLKSLGYDYHDIEEYREDHQIKIYSRN